jgi:hypothetical protein
VRGRLVSLNQLMITVGIVATYVPETRGRAFADTDAELQARVG